MVLALVTQRSNPCGGVDREPPYYPAFYEFNPAIRSHARRRSRRLILFSLGLWRTLYEISTFYNCPRSCSGRYGPSAKRERRGTIRKLDNERIQAQIHADAAALDRIYAADFIGVGPKWHSENEAAGDFRFHVRCFEVSIYHD